MKKRRYAGILFVLPGLLGAMVFYFIPFLDVIRRSFTKAAGGFSGLDNYKLVWNNEAFRLAAKNTFLFVAVCIPLLLVLSLAAAVLLLHVKKYAGIVKSAYLIPLAIPAASVVLIWRILFDAHGMVNGALAVFGVAGRDWMNTGSAFYVLVGSYIWKNFGYVVVLWIAAMAQISKSVYEAAWMDGAGSRQAFFYITLPGIRPAAFTIVIICFLNSFKVFREAYLVAGNYPQESIYLLQHVFNNWFLSLSVDKMATGAVLLSIVIFGLVQLLQRAWRIQ